jgi:hypothetical protein
MYKQSSESAHACVVKYIRARLPSQARRAGLSSQTRTCMGTFRGLSEPGSRVKLAEPDSYVYGHLNTAPELFCYTER